MRALEGGDELGVEEGGLEVLETGGDVSGGSEVLVERERGRKKVSGRKRGREGGREGGRGKGRTGSWSIAQGMRQGTSVLSPKIWGKELEKEGAAWMEGK